MRKSLLLCALSVLFGSNWLIAQVFLGGSASFNNTHWNTGQINTSSLRLYPQIGYFKKENVALGAYVGFDATSNSTLKFNNLSFEPFARRYFSIVNKFSFYIEGSVSISVTANPQTQYTQEMPNSLTAGLNFHPGVSYKLNDRFSVETKLGGIQYIFQKTGSSKTTDLELYVGSYLNFNLIYKFGKKLKSGAEILNQNRSDASIKNSLYTYSETDTLKFLKKGLFTYGNSQPRKIWKRLDYTPEFKEVMKFNPEAQLEFNKVKYYTYISYPCAIGLVGVGINDLLKTLNDVKQLNNNTMPNRGFRVNDLVPVAILFCASIYVLIEGKKHTKKGLKLFNSH